MRAVDHRVILLEHQFRLSADFLWAALTKPELIARWLMAPVGFAPVRGTKFIFEASSDQFWNGTVHCEVVAAELRRCLAYRWVGNWPDRNGQTALLDTLVSFELNPTGDGVRLQLTHSGFVLPQNEVALVTMTAVWSAIVPAIAAIPAVRLERDQQKRVVRTVQKNEVLGIPA